MNSVDDIIRDRVILQRERNLNVNIGYYVTAKFLTLCVFSALQCALFVVVGNWILEVRGMFQTHPLSVRAIAVVVRDAGFARDRVGADTSAAHYAPG
jgi:hypothetical protein